VPAVVRALDVRAAPTLVVFRDGRPVERLDDGVQLAERLVGLLEAHAR
jgi:thioredoxin-like negative regulator of GroEL